MDKETVSRPPEIDKIADRVTFLAIIPLTVGAAFVTVWLASSDTVDWRYFAGGIAIIVAGTFILKVAQDFRRLKTWTWPIVSLLAVCEWSMEKYIHDPEVRKAFGRDEGPYQTHWHSGPDS